MKRYLLFFLIVWAMGNVYGKNASLFSYNHEKVNKALVSVNILERYVSAHKLTLNQLSTDNPLTKNLRADMDSPVSPRESVLGIPGFFWGFVLNVVGVLIVYFVTKDAVETSRAFIGCTTIVTLILFIYFLSDF